MKVSLLGLGTEATVGIALLAIIAAIAFARSREPLDRDRLAIEIASLKSQASEAQMLVEALHQDRLTPKLARMHAQQLREATRRTDHTLDEKAVNPSLAASREKSRGLASQLDAELQLLGSGKRDFVLDADHGAPGVVSFAALAKQLDSLHSELKPPDSTSP
jgi:hypothetical protein